MCGIWALIGKPIDKDSAAACLDKLKARGPESSKLLTNYRFQLGFTRLALNGLNNGAMQPMTSNELQWICNGEIYNWKDIGYSNSGSDCEVLGSFYRKCKTPGSFFRGLRGVFACVIIDVFTNTAIVGRDPYGVRPLFMSKNKDSILFTSEIKASPYTKIVPFPPGFYARIDMTTLNIEFTKYHNIEKRIINNPFQSIRNSLVNAVHIRMMTERPIAALLSGGLDSSLIAAIVQQELTKANKPPLKTFSIGFEGSEDLKYAKIVSQHIGSDHTEIVMTPSEFFDVIPAVIYDIESFDITTVRASVGNWLVAREIAKTDCKVVFNGDGSDELFGGYLYFHRAPYNQAFEDESDRLLQDIHLFDVLRSDRCISSHGLEPRTPFLDKEFVNVVKSVSVDLRRPNATQPEKWILRKAFDDGILPTEVLWRKKEAFSDGVSTPQGLSWFQECQSRALVIVPDWETHCSKYTHLKPYTAESFYYRQLFSKTYNHAETVIPYFWMPKWSPETTDPSAKTLNPTTVNTG